MLAIEYLPDKEDPQNRRVVADFPSSENIHTIIEHPAICYEKLLAIEFSPVSGEHPLRQDQGLTNKSRPKKVTLKWKTKAKRKTGEVSSMKV